jgi:dihydroorotate dehydrogenase (fumarate)
MNLATDYLGLKLRSPLVPSASPLSQNLDNIRKMEDAGASAVVLHSLFEEQIQYERYAAKSRIADGREGFPEPLNYFSESPNFAKNPESYLCVIAQAKEATAIPIIASLNACTPGGWVEFAKCIEQAGADALELNIYNVPTDIHVSSERIELEVLDILKSVRRQVQIPIAVKLSPFFTNLAHLAYSLERAGANGLVLFNRFYQPDIELESREVAAHVFYSTPMDLRLPLRWIAILRDRIGASLAASSGIHRGTDALKMLMAGADVTMLCSALMRKGIEHLSVIEREIRAWMEEHECESIAELKGTLSQKNCPDATAFERAQYVQVITSAKVVS